MVNLQMMNKESRSYFQQAFIVDGALWYAIQTTNNQTVQIVEFAKQIGVRLRSNSEIIKFLQSISIKIIEHQSSQFSFDPFFYWRPVIESKHINPWNCSKPFSFCVVTFYSILILIMHIFHSRKGR